MAHSNLSKSGAAQILHLLSAEPGPAVRRMNSARLEQVIAAVPVYIAALQEVLDAAQAEVQRQADAHRRETPA